MKQDVEEAQFKSSISVTNPPKPLEQSEIYDGEKLQMFTYLNNLITKLSIEKERLITSRNINVIQCLIIIIIKHSINLNNKYFFSESPKPKIEEKKNDLRERIKTVNEIVDQLTGLINIEKSRLLLIKDAKEQHSYLFFHHSILKYSDSNILYFFNQRLFFGLHPLPTTIAC